MLLYEQGRSKSNTRAGPAGSSHLFAAVDAVLAEDRRAACCHPHSGQRVAVNLVLLDHPLTFLVLEERAGWSG